MLNWKTCVLVGIFLSIQYGYASQNMDEAAVNQYIEDAVATLKLKIHQAGQRYGKGRFRRSVQSPSGTNSSGQVIRLSSINPFALIPTNHSVELEPFQIDGVQYIGVVNYGFENVPSAIYRMVGDKFVLHQEFNVPGCVDFTYANYGGNKYVIFAEKVGRKWDGTLSYERTYQVYRYLAPTFRKIGSVATKGGMCVKAFQSDNKEYFVAANSVDSWGRRALKSTLHVKTDFGFSLAQEFDTFGAQDVELFTINGIIYMIFANHVNDEGMVDIYSTFYRQKSTTSTNGLISFEQVQKIATHGARDFEYFKMNNNHYIVVANEYTQLISYEYDQVTNNKKMRITKDYEIDSIIYWWSGKFFVEWQRIPTNCARKWTHFYGPNGETFLTIANSRSEGIIYVYDPAIGLFKPSQVQGLNPLPGSSHLPEVRSVRPFYIGKKTYLAVANYNETKGHNIFRLNFTFQAAVDERPSVEKQLRKALNDVAARMDKLKTWLGDIKQLLTKVMTLTGNQTAHGSNWFKNVTIKRLRVKGDVLYTNHIENNPIERATQHARDISQNLTRQNSIIKELQRRLNDSVSRTGTNDVTGTKTFTGPVAMKNVTVDSITVGTINGINLTELEQRAWSKSKEQIITGKNVFMTDVKIQKDVTVEGTVNGIRIPEDVMTRHSDQRVTGKKMFTQPVTILGSIKTINATMNGLRIPEDLVLRSSDQRVEGKKIFNGTVEFNQSLHVNGTVNGEDLSEFSKRVVTLSTDQLISGRKNFTSGFSVGRNLDVSGMIDGVNLDDIDKDAVRVGEEEIIKGKKTVLGSVFINGNVKTMSTTNGHRLQDDVMTTTTDQVINVAKTFGNITVKGNIITSSTIDGINLSEEAVTKSGDQTITGRKTFEADITVNGNITISGTVDTVDISELDKNAVKIIGENIITAPKVFTGKVTVQDINVSGKLNGINLKQLRENIWTIDGNHTVTAPMTFENIHFSNDLEVNGKVNGVRIPDDLVSLKKPQVISDNVTFADKVIFAGEMNFGDNSTLNGENFPTFMKSVVLNGTDQEIYGEKTIAADLIVEKGLLVDGKINGFSVPDDFVTLNTEQVIRGKKTFRSGITVKGTLSTGVINVSTTVNGVDISELKANAVYKGQNQSINGTVIFTGNVSSAGAVTVKKLVDGVNITELAETAVRLSKPQNISGNKIFINDVEFHAPLISPGLVNNIDLRELERNSMKKQGSQSVTGRKVFKKTVVIEGNLDNGTINGVNLGNLREDVVTKEGNEIINGDLKFISNVTCDNMLVEGTIDGLKLHELMMTHGNQTVHGNKVFDGDIKLLKNLKVDGFINGVNLTELDSEIVKVFGDQNIWGNLIFKNGFHANQSIDISGSVNGVDISELSANAVRINDSGVIGGKKTFLKDVTVLGNVEFRDNVNGVNITELFSDVMSKSKAQNITGKKIFASTSSTKVTENVYTGDINVGGLVDGVNITDLDTKAVKLSTDQELFGDYTFINEVNFTDGIQLKGLLNGINISSDVMLVHMDQIVEGTKTFNELVVNGSIKITGKIDGVDVSEFAKSRVTLSTNQTIYGQITFGSSVTTKGEIKLPENGTVNGIDISEEILTTDGPLIVSGEKTFIQDIIINGEFNVSGFVNGIDLQEMSEDIVLVDSSKELTGTNTFTNLTIKGNLFVNGYVNGIKVEIVANNTKELTRRINAEIATLNATSKPICSQIKVLLGLAGIQVQVSGVEKCQNFAISKGGRIDAKTIGNHVYVGISRASSSGCGPAHILRCTNAMVCELHRIIKTQAIFMQFYEFGGNSYLFVGHYGSNQTGCPSYPEILKFDKGRQEFISVHNITSSLYSSLTNISDNDVIVQNIASLIPYAVLTSPLFATPVTALGSLLTTPPILTRTFRRNGISYLVTASVYVDTYYIEFFILDPKTFATTKLQRISTRDVSEMDVGVVNGKTMLAVAEGRQSDERSVNTYMFVEEKKLFYFYQRITQQAVSVRFATIHNRFYFAFASPDFGFGLCPWRGVMGFEGCMTVPEAGISHITVVTSVNGVFTLGLKDSALVVHRVRFEGVSPKFNGTLTC